MPAWPRPSRKQGPRGRWDGRGGPRPQQRRGVGLASRPRHWGPGRCGVGERRVQGPGLVRPYGPVGAWGGVRLPRSGQPAVPCPSSATPALVGRTLLGGRAGLGDAQRLCIPVPGAASATIAHGPLGVAVSCGQGRACVGGGRSPEAQRPRVGNPAPQHGAGGDGPQRTLYGRRGAVRCGPRLSLGVGLLRAALLPGVGQGESRACTTALCHTRRCPLGSAAPPALPSLGVRPGPLRRSCCRTYRPVGLCSLGGAARALSCVGAVVVAPGPSSRVAGVACLSPGARARRGQVVPRPVPWEGAVCPALRGRPVGSGCGGRGQPSVPCSSRARPAPGASRCQAVGPGMVMPRALPCWCLALCPSPSPKSRWA